MTSANEKLENEWGAQLLGLVAAGLARDSSERAITVMEQICEERLHSRNEGNLALYYRDTALTEVVRSTATRAWSEALHITERIITEYLRSCGSLVP